ncbi:3-isopropylmalate dehydratase small subunit [Falsiroseomonas selenitidurans]|uniref:3-isopropylmalate dehydratase small subunit n=1 Tax=Falsiroseomonas selenitidurans TaxID=2716335 RepID=A0ABX1E1E9_9PROT|nr:3-isopropylmalate dehydratase small subunit [Falsiroseomonas selenitidurans]NKC30991.1 3-isopropylmalate dehydratase small subunit [Falsiroseomonas selenitidurans]
MEPFTRYTAIAAPFDQANVDTDQIMPARFMRRPRDERYATYGFHDQRYTPEGAKRPDFILNQPPFDAAGILVAGRNFGVGSSREAAVYALLAMGHRCVVAPSFGDIFFSNALKNGLLPVRLPESTVNALRQAVATSPGTTLSVDLERQELTGPDGTAHQFAIPGFARECLLRGLDEIGLTLTLAPDIAAFEARRDAAR